MIKGSMYRAAAVSIAVAVCISVGGGNLFSETFTPNFVADIADDGEYLWLASDCGLVKFHKATGTRTYYTEETSDIPSDNTRSVAVVGNDIWIGTNLNGIGIFNGAAWDSMNTSNSGLPYDISVRDIMPATDGSAWVAVAPAWVCRYADGVWENHELYETSPASSFEAVYAIAEGLDGTIWAGAKGRTVYGPEQSGYETRVGTRQRTVCCYCRT